MKRITIKKQMVCLICIACVVVLLGGCTLPTYNLSMGGSPSKALDSFMKAVVNGEDEKVGRMLYNYTWDGKSDLENQEFGKNDKAIFACLRSGRSYQIDDSAEQRLDSHHAIVPMDFTTFDIAKFRDTLSKDVVAAVQQKQFEGSVFEETSDIDPIVEEVKAELLKDPQRFQTTARFDVEMISHKGRWKVVLTDELYSALTGYAA